MKKYLSVLALLGLLTSAIFAFYALNEFIYNEKQGDYEITTPHKTSDEIIKPATSDNQALIAEIEKALVTKHGSDAESLRVSVSEISGNYAKGEVSETGMGGGVWFAAKTNDVWQLVFDGNGIILCSDLEQFPNFPSSLIHQCFDDAKNTLIKR